ncbi:MAG: hypothetical protein LUC24_03850, partial [Bacteroidales bacterium]|nr:hypothetical protein [Bacteroidales bacterium]
YMEKNLSKAEAAGQVKLPDWGWDSSKSIYELTAEEIEAAAAFRGGHFLGRPSGQKNTLYEWVCEEGHHFTATLEYVLLGGGWCTECPLDRIYTAPDDKNKFLAQILRPAPQK